MLLSFIPVVMGVLATAHVHGTSRLSAIKRGPGCDGLGETALSDLSSESFTLSVSGGNSDYSLVFRDSGKTVGDAEIYALAVSLHFEPQNK